MSSAARRRISGRPMDKPEAARFAWAVAPSWLLPLLLLLATAIGEPPSNADELPACKRGQYLDPVTGKCHSCTHGIDFVDEDYNRQPHCQPCSYCLSMKVEVEPCTTSKDTVCRCPRGFRENVEGLCSPSYWHGLATTAAPSAITTPSAAGAAGTTESPGHHPSDVLSDRVRQAEDQPGRHLAYNGDMGWSPFLVALMVISLVIVLTIVAMTWQNQRDQAPPPAATSGMQPSPSSVVVMNPGQNSPTTSQALDKNHSHIEVEHNLPSYLLLENHELQSLLQQNENARDS